MATPNSFFDQLTDLTRGFETELKAREDVLTAREDVLTARERDLEQKIARWRKTAEDFAKAQAIMLDAASHPSEVTRVPADARIKPYDRREETTVHADTNKKFAATYYEAADGSRLAWAKYNDTPDKIARRFSKLRLEVNELVRLNISFYPDLAETTKLSTGTVFALNIGGRWRIDARESDDGREVYDEDSDDGMRVSIQGKVGGFSNKKKKRGGAFDGHGSTIGGVKKRARTAEAKRAVLLDALESRTAPPVTLTPAEVEAALFDGVV